MAVTIEEFGPPHDTMYRAILTYEVDAREQNWSEWFRGRKPPQKKVVKSYVSTTGNFWFQEPSGEEPSFWRSEALRDAHRSWKTMQKLAKIESEL